MSHHDKPDSADSPSFLNTSGVRRIYLRPLRHKDEDQIGLYFEYDPELKDLIKGYPGVRWTQTHKCFYVLRTEENVRGFLMHIKGKGVWVDTSAMRDSVAFSYVPSTTRNKVKATHMKRKELSPEIQERIESFRRYMEQRRYSSSTVKTYRSMVLQFLAGNTGKDWAALTMQDVEDYNHREYIVRKKSHSTQNQFINAIKLFYECQGRGNIVPREIERPRRERKLPNVLTHDEVKRLLQSVANLKHRTMLSLLYACGLRIGDALALRPEDIRETEGLLYIRGGKGRKDRRAPLTGPIMTMLRNYLDTYKPVRYVFEGAKGERYSYKSAQQVMKRAVRAAGLRQQVTLHTLRHSYATHQIQMGTDSRYVQEILGHADPKTTMLYTHIAANDIRRIKSPFDDMDIR